MKKLLVVILFATLSGSIFAEGTPPVDPAPAASASVDQGGAEDSEAAGWVPPKLTARFGGRLQLDYAWFDDDLVERDSSGEVRRARLFVKGQIGDEWDYKVQLEFAGSDPELKDGFVRYHGMGPGTLWIGNFKQPNGMETMASSKNTTFMERGLVTDVNEGRRLGVGYQFVASNYSLMGSVYGDEANGVVEGNGVAGRATWTPIKADQMTVHLGASLAYSEPQDGELRIRVRPESHGTDDRILDTGTIENVDNVVKVGLEGAVVRGRFSAQAEYVQGDLSRTGDPDVSFDGWYGYASWFLTPDSRKYSSGEGVFDKVTPTGRGGAWELALRFSTLDLTDEDILGGSADVVTFGVNWYANQYLRFLANYSAVDSDEVAGNDDPNVLQVRMQIVF